jgi:uncharacterized protein
MKCPICKRDVEESKGGERNRFHPFCSERCKLIDLGRWLGGRYQIPLAEEEDDHAAARPFTPDDADA